MGNIKLDLHAMIFMKFGYHALEDENDIIARKQKEYLDTGRIFWGYGGTICHPINQVQPFVKREIQQGRKVFVAMSFTKSKPSMEASLVNNYSEDGINWNNVPEGIKITGSKNALVFSKLNNVNLTISLDDYIVGIGPSHGKIASEYIKYRTDKGCLIKSKTNEKSNKNYVKIQLLAELIQPYAVMLK